MWILDQKTNKNPPPATTTKYYTLTYHIQPLENQDKIHHTQWAKSECFSLKIRDQTRISAFSTLIQHCTRSYSNSNNTRKRNKRHPNWKGGSKPVIMWRWHDNVHRKHKSLHQKTTQPNKWIWQRSKVWSQYSEINGIYVHQQWTIRKKIPLTIATRKIKC